MTVTWDAGTAISGAGTVTPSSPYARVNLNVIPDYFSRSTDAPARYRNIGVVGVVDGAYRSPGTRLLYAAQEFAVDLVAGTDLYWVLETGVSGTLYRGTGSMSEEAVVVKVRNSADQSIPNGAQTVVTFNTEVVDPWGMHSTAANTGRITIAVPGWYSVTAQAHMDANAVGQRSASILLNGATQLASSVVPAAGFAGFYATLGVGWAGPLVAGDYLELVVFQNSGGALNSKTFGTESPALTAVRVA